MLIIGVTGGIGSGKSLVCGILEAMGLPVYDMDSKAKRLYDSDPELKASMIRLIGEDIYTSSPDGRLNRAMLSGLIFGNAKLLAEVNRLVHPAVRRDLAQWLGEEQGSGRERVAVESALLLASEGLAQMVNHRLVVSAPEPLRLERAMRRDGASAEAIRLRMSKQMPEAEMIALADSVIYNDGRALLPQLVRLLSRLS